MARKIIDHTGQRFGRWTVLKRGPDYVSYDGKHKMARWYCKCDYGNVRLVTGATLKQGTSVSCGCYRRESVSAAQKYRHAINKYGRNAIYG